MADLSSVVSCFTGSFFVGIFPSLPFPLRGPGRLPVGFAGMLAEADATEGVPLAVASDVEALASCDGAVPAASMGCQRHFLPSSESAGTSSTTLQRATGSHGPLGTIGRRVDLDYARCLLPGEPITFDDLHHLPGRRCLHRQGRRCGQGRFERGVCILSGSDLGKSELPAEMN